MGVWDSYEARLSHISLNMDHQRSSAHQHISDRLRRTISSSLSYKTAQCNGQKIQIAIINTSDDMNVKKVFSMPGESLSHGSIINWKNSNWLVTDLDADNEIYSSGKMQRCNYYLKWINDSGNIIGRWCVVEDGTNYLTGETPGDIITTGASRVAITIGKDSETSQINRGRRFLIDDMDSKDVLAYEVTKTNKMFNVFNGAGVFRFILSETDVTDYDNKEKRIADYYGWEPKHGDIVSDVQEDKPYEDMIEDARNKTNLTKARAEESGVWL